MKLIRRLLFIGMVPFIAAGIGLWCAFISLKQGIECAAEMLDE
jgi:hypothetical protein